MNSPLDSKDSQGLLEAHRLKRVQGTLGLALRAGELRLGSDAALEMVRRRRASLVLLATDAGPNIEKKVRDKCAFYDIPVLQVLDRRQFGQACGRREAVVGAVIGPGFAQSLLRQCGKDTRG